MNPSKIKEGQLITCKEGYYLGTFSSEPFSDFESPYIPWLAISSLDFTTNNINSSSNQWLYGVGEVMIYLGKKCSQLSLEIMHVTDSAPYKNVVQHHEVLWRGSVYKIRTSNFKRLTSLSCRRKR